MIKFYGGGLSYQQIMDMPFKTFLMMYDYMLWQLREGSEDGQKLNKRIERTDIMQVFGADAAKYNRSRSVDDSFKKLKRTMKQT